ncbi:unnamed protein product (macronuclear) [Paramecium tetraurelia]|uniref:Uncharacterized protein n=1 Tax=Paramecium tetraurelia TaxID=5888 RepID=A0CH85_PARTE|nr:uncharacterized protein GSPATT00007592001 [Paramecium tetraurelia]CAK70152.1 unnamed protein product [Paramecium tetraurelia]|eukprot:XP_001437549.1 hypothetical protein (macronuclear) [Paramecium tetraurelia strain d4-2]
MATGGQILRYNGGTCYAMCQDVFSWYNPSIQICWKGCDYATGRKQKTCAKDIQLKRCGQKKENQIIWKTQEFMLICSQKTLEIFIEHVWLEFVDKNIESQQQNIKQYIAVSQDKQFLMLSFQSLNSKDSLDEFLPMFHNKDNKKAILNQQEQSVIKYLRQLGVIMKTDPLKKQQEHYQQQLFMTLIRQIKIVQVLVSQPDNDDQDVVNILSPNDVSLLKQNVNELCTFNNKIILNKKRVKLEQERKHSFEDFDFQ